MGYAEPIVETNKARPSGLAWANAHRLADDMAREIASIESEAFRRVARGERLIKRS